MGSRAGAWSDRGDWSGSSVEKGRASKDDPVDRRVETLLGRPLADDAEERERRVDEVALPVEADVAEDAVLDAGAEDLTCDRGARPVRPPDRVEKDLGGLCAVRGAEVRPGARGPRSRETLEELPSAWR